jgi:tRNA A37 threonylcarbamoyladenosine synthetase subunit TsaC/SUA5/YrdC
MQDLENAEKRICEIKEKRKQEDIKTCYSNLESLSNIINDLNKLSDPILKKNKEKLIEKCNEEKKTKYKIYNFTII